MLDDCLGLERFTFPSVPHLLPCGPENKGGNWELAVGEVHSVGMAFVAAVRPAGDPPNAA